MKKLLFITVLMLIFSTSIFAEPINMEFKYKKNIRNSYSLEDSITLNSVQAFGQSMIDRTYELKVKSDIFERATELEKAGGAQVKSVVKINNVYVDGKSESFGDPNDYQVAAFDNKGKMIRMVESSDNGFVRKFDEKTKPIIYRKFTDLLNALFILPDKPIEVGESWSPEPITIANNKISKSEFTLKKIETKDKEELAYISGTTTVEMDLKDALDYFKNVIPNILAYHNLQGTAKITTTKNDIVFSITKGLIKSNDIETSVAMDVMEIGSGMTFNVSLSTKSKLELTLSEVAK